MKKPTRAIARYHGGKWALGPWIIGQLPPRRVYNEPYSGFGSILLRSPRSPIEILNDLDGEIVNAFRVLRNPAQARELQRQIELTPFSREEFELASAPDGDPIEQARRTLFRFAAGHSTAGAQKWQTGFRTYHGPDRSTSPASDWANYAHAIPLFTTRLREVIIEHIPALECLRRYDGLDTLHYVDPPYVYATRNPRQAGNCYRHEMTDDDHRELAETLHSLAGMVVLSGYPSALYDELFGEWKRVDKAATGEGGKRTESLWFNPAAANAVRLPMEVT